MAVLELHCSGQAFSNWEEQGLLSGCSAWAFHCRGFSRCRSQALGARALRAEARGLSCHATRGIFPDQGSNLCLRPWQIDSQPLDHGGSPKFYSWQESIGPLMLTIWLWGSCDHQPMTILVRMWVSPKMSSQRNANWTQLRPWVHCISKDGLNFPLGSEWLLSFTQNLVCLSVSIPYCLRTLLSGLSGLTPQGQECLPLVTSTWTAPSPGHRV